MSEKPNPPTSRATGLACRACGEEFPLERRFYCEECFGPLTALYDYPDSLPQTAEEWSSLFPFGAGSEAEPTPLVHLPRLGALLGLNRLSVKDEGASRLSGSFKDRVTHAACSAAHAFGIQTVAASSTGNLAAALAMAASLRSLRSVLLVPRSLDDARKRLYRALGATVVEVEGNYDEANRLATELIGELEWGWANGDLKPYYLEGARGILFEIYRQSDPDDLPRHLIVPMAGGGLLSMMGKALQEIQSMSSRPWELKIHGVQAEGCSPIIRAFEEGHDRIRPVKPNTIAHSIAVGDPGDGVDALATIRLTGGKAVAAAETDLRPMAQRLVRNEGIYTEAAGAAALVAAERLAREGAIGPDESVAALLTASGVGRPFLENASGPEADSLVCGPDVKDFLERTAPLIETEWERQSSNE